MFKYFKILFFIAIAYLPFQIALNPSQGIDLASSRIIIAILIAYWLYYSFFVQKQEKFLEKKNLIGILLILFLLWSVFSLIWADNFPFAFRKVIFLLNILPFYFVAQIFLKTKKDLIIFFKTLIYSSALVAFIAITQFSLQFIYSPYWVFNKWFLFYPFLFGKTSAISAMLLSPNWLTNIDGKVFMRSIGSFPDPNTFGFYLAFVIPAALLIKNKYFKTIGALLILSLLFTFSRGAYLGAIVAFIISIFIFGLKYLKNKKNIIINRKLRYAISSAKFKYYKLKVFLLLFIVFCSLFFIIPAGQRLVSSFNFQDKGVSERFEIWSKAISVIKENLILGAGIGNYVEKVDLFSEQRGYRSPIHAHNIYLQITAELGIIGLILYLAVFVFAIKNIISYKFVEKWQIAVFLSLIWFSVHGFFDIPIFSPRILPLLVIFLALANYKEKETINNE